MALKVPAIKLSKYPFRCKDHKCAGPRTPRPVFIHLHGTPAIRPEIQQALSVLLQELFLPASEGSYVSTFSNEAVDLHEATPPLLPATILQPVTTPGVHFQCILHLITILGIIVGTDAGTPRPGDRASARGMEHIGDEGPGMSANGTQSGPGGPISRSVIRAPATSQEGEAMTLVVYTVAAGVHKGKVVWIVGDSQS